MPQQTTNSQETIGQLEALTRCDEYLQFAVKVIEQSNLPESVGIEMQQQIERIEQRRTDPNLYLAVVGEFSSGKSTFINALLRDDLLKTSTLVATAAATRLRYGNDLEVEVRYQGRRPGTFKTNSQSDHITIPWWPTIHRINNRQFIQAVTSKDEVVKYVVDVTISHPSTFLANSIVIIDTPGANAINPQHEAITRQVIENEADLVIIVVPATIPLSQSLSNFLSSSLRPFLHRCIFVVTRMDQIRVQEQSELLNTLRRRFVDQLGIKPAMLCACSAQVFLDDFSDKETVPENLQVWKERFTQLEQIIINHLRRERLVSIAENLLRLLTLLFEQLESHLRLQREKIDTYVTWYKSVAETSCDDQKTELPRLLKLQESTQANLLEIDRQRKSLSAQQQRLAENSI